MKTLKFFFTAMVVVWGINLAAAFVSPALPLVKQDLGLIESRVEEINNLIGRVSK